MGMNSSILNRRQIPLWLKIAYTTFVAVLIPVYWYHYTPVNFLYFCDVALLVTVAAVWLESSLLASMMAIGITLPQLMWQVDFLTFPLLGVHFPADFTGYMFEEQRPLYLRALSFFHFWLPILLVWMVWRLGYDRRALPAQIGLSMLVLLMSYFLTPKIDGPAGNVNKVFGLDDKAPHLNIPQLLWVANLMAIWNNAYLVTHALFCWVMPRRQRDPR